MDAKQVDEIWDRIKDAENRAAHDFKGPGPFPEGAIKAADAAGKAELARILNRELGTVVVPEDDAEPVTEEWLSRQTDCPRAVNGPAYLFKAELGGLALVQIVADGSFNIVPIDDGLRLSTRGHVRRLCAALGISLAPEAGP